MPALYNKLGYQKIEVAARRTRHEFWRETYRHAFYRRLITRVLGIVLAAIGIWLFMVVVFSAR